MTDSNSRSSGSGKRPTHVIFGAGPIGLATADALLERGEPVRVVSRSGSTKLPAGVESIRGDAADPAFAESAVDGASAVYQALGPPYHQWAELFPPLQKSVVAAAQSVNARYVSFENLYMYGDPKGQVINEESPIQTHTRKGKLRQEMASELKTLSVNGDLQLATARASSYFGPRAGWQSPLGERVIGRAIQGKSAQVIGDPDARHSFTYTKDAGRVLATLGSEDRSLGEIWHIPNAPALTVREMVKLIGNKLEREIKVSPAPAVVLKVMGLWNPTIRELHEMLYTVESDYIAESSKFTDAFGLQATPTNQAIAETVDDWL